MGLQQHANENTPPSTSSVPIQASDLPPAALELAGKLFDFARQGKTEELAQYVSAGIPPNLTNSKGDTLLMLAAYHGHAATTRMLLEKGADPNVLNDRGQSPIAGAVFKGSDEVVQLLFERHADVYAGQPNAMDSAHMFRKENYLTLFGAEQQ
ncbi:hypothetical protein AUEXF2481DRAFT_4787 [Aureobasidium subglaciale EXF-2481]|uniref:Uncharacterized protein n=1 Tax=Aureobasidium subglaciale (strain EXF-2481) TaxID=1043005 RepID=A0A074YDE3_AURSE|nr:uncharacterized protein AUEXF2481DRAFT_4787 [Aureobasidium subglaciale EXF-2481]KAI5201728.1 ankyrin [Aureobasidium subglaciale]KAI5220553.1 ankyrin [Aureobasidium subglaciale]KAI5224219.1 ankyrin [Aureobasidium subglaciale]KAI5260761.1 ankyrin [Aureobasidium subglaciale]KEQ95833.1 hypothetical protein AUEXF2481DRAFT_4787 [Aureobasidium subglaciale EXF-2481]